MTRAERDAEQDRQLGMRYSVARNKLMRKILFSCVQRFNEDRCFRCGEKIDTLPEFTIEHKEPWLHVNPELFWDMDNIAFSHKTCNSGARRSNPYPYNVYPSKQEQYRAGFKRWYDKPGNREVWNARQRDRYAAVGRKDRSTAGMDKLVKSPPGNPRSSGVSGAGKAVYTGDPATVTHGSP